MTLLSWLVLCHHSDGLLFHLGGAAGQLEDLVVM